MQILDLVRRRSHEWSFYARNTSGKTLPQLQFQKIASGGDLIVIYFFSDYTTALMTEDFRYGIM